MRDVQSTFRGYAPDPRGGLRPPELVYETDEHARPRFNIGSIFLGLLTVILSIYGVAAFVMGLFGADVPTLINAP